MPKRALAEHRPWLLASMTAAALYYFFADNPIPGIWLMLLKGTGVALLAVYALQRHPSSDARMIALVMAIGALGDMAIEFSFTAGGAAFFLGHIVAIALYLRNKRERLGPFDWLLAAAIFVATPGVSWLLSTDLAVTTYAAGLGAMAAAAFLSRFPRGRVATGAALFVLSDWLIFSRMGPVGDNVLADWLIWPLYYSGQFLIASGVIQTLRGELRPG
jgi:uncharacterized membrane protein YhhN